MNNLPPGTTASDIDKHFGEPTTETDECPICHYERSLKREKGEDTWHCYNDDCGWSGSSIERDNEFAKMTSIGAEKLLRKENAASINAEANKLVEQLLKNDN